MIFAAVAQVGLVFTVVGAVTGSKELLQIGGFLGLAGGIGGLASGGASAAASVTTDVVGDAAVSAATDAAATTGAANTAGEVINQSAGALESGIAPALETTLAPIATTPIATTPIATAPIATPTLAQPAINGLDLPGANNVAGVQDVSGAANWQSGVQDPFTKDVMGIGQSTKPSSDFFGSFGDFVNNNKNLLAGAAKGMFEADEMKKKRALQQREIDINQQRVNQTSHGSAMIATAPAMPRGIVSGAKK